MSPSILKLIFSGDGMHPTTCLLGRSLGDEALAAMCQQVWDVSKDLHWSKKKKIPWYGMKNLHIPCSSLGHRRGFGLLGVDNESMKMAGLVQPVGLPTRLV